MGLPATTGEEIYIGAGDMYIDGGLGGATLDNNVFRVVQERPNLKVNGSPGPIVGLDYIGSETAELESTLADLTDTNLGIQIPAAVASTVGVDHIVTSGAVTSRRIGSAAYRQYQLRVPGLDGREVRFKLVKAIAVGNAQYEAKDDGILAPRLTLQARWTPNPTLVSPWEIRRVPAGGS